MYVHPLGVWGPLPKYKNWDDVPTDYVGPILSHHNEVLFIKGRETFHREEGPARYYKDGTPGDYWLNGVYMLKREHLRVTTKLGKALYG